MPQKFISVSNRIKCKKRRSCAESFGGENGIFFIWVTLKWIIDNSKSRRLNYHLCGEVQEKKCNGGNIGNARVFSLSFPFSTIDRESRVKREREDYG